MTDNLPGVQWIPSNPDSGNFFIHRNCLSCGRDRPACEGVSYDECEDHELCPIIAASFIGEAIQWRRLENGELICTEYGKPAVNKNQEQLIWLTLS